MLNILLVVKGASQKKKARTRKRRGLNFPMIAAKRRNITLKNDYISGALGDRPFAVL